MLREWIPRPARNRNGNDKDTDGNRRKNDLEDLEVVGRRVVTRWRDGNAVLLSHGVDEAALATAGLEDDEVPGVHHCPTMCRVHKYTNQRWLMYFDG